MSWHWRDYSTTAPLTVGGDDVPLPSAAARSGAPFWRRMRQQPRGIPYESLDWMLDPRGFDPTKNPGVQYFVPADGARLDVRQFQGPG
jgi:hypothetical protein